MKTIVYIDGFNLYYRALKNTKYKWLNLERLINELLPKNHVVEIKYFTARTSVRDGDAGHPLRQQVYLRALGTTPIVKTIFGHFLTNEKFKPLVNPPAGGPKFAKVIITEEKGSDVNLAVHLVHDAHSNRADAFAVLSADSDLAEAMRIARDELGKTIVYLSPSKRVSKELNSLSTYVRTIRPAALLVSQFSRELTDAHGIFHRPPEWD